METIKNKIAKTTNESILGSVNGGIASFLSKFEEKYNVKIEGTNSDGVYVIESLQIMDGSDFEFPPIPLHIDIFEIHNLKSFKNFPKSFYNLYIFDSDIKNFNEIKDVKVSNLYVSNCKIGNITTLPIVKKSIHIGNNINKIFTVKEIAKATGLNKNDISVLGQINNGKTLKYAVKKDYLGENDKEHIMSELKKFEELLKKNVPELKTVSASLNTSWDIDSFHFTLDFLNKEDWPHGYGDNSIFLEFRYDTNDKKIELARKGHLNLTKKDREGKYKYFALKSVIAPYVDNGGKPFRKCEMLDFNAETLNDKLGKWVKAVIDAAVKDQGGELKRQ